jgi:hypothetical protein
MNNLIELEIAAFILMLCGWIFLAGIRLRLPKITKAKLSHAMEKFKPAQRNESAKEYVRRIDGKQKESMFTRSRREAEQVYSQTGQIQAYKKTIVFAWVVAGCGAIIGLAMRNIFLAIVLAVGGYFLPLWWSKFALYRHDKFVNEELEIALGLTTTSLARNNDTLAAVEENLVNINPPVKDTLLVFSNNLRFVNANAPALIEEMKGEFDSKIFHQWCDALILCQEDDTLRATLPPIVNKFSDQKAQQMANETKMMLPVRRAVSMICITLSIIPIYWMCNADWYNSLTGTLFGQVSLVLTAIVTLMTINKAIRISKPIEYDV